MTGNHPTGRHRSDSLFPFIPSFVGNVYSCLFRALLITPVYTLNLVDHRLLDLLDFPLDFVMTSPLRTSTATMPAADVSAHRPTVQIAASRMSRVKSLRHSNCLHCRVVLCAFVVGCSVCICCWVLCVQQLVI